MSFQQVATVSYQGTVVAFARSDVRPKGNEGPSEVPGPLRTDIHYNVLSLDVDSTSDALDWDGWRRLDLPNEVRPSGMQLINVPVDYDRDAGLKDLADAGAPFRVITNQEYVYLMRQAVGGTLLVNRLRLVRRTSPDNPEEVEYVLMPAWEVRFQRSGKPDLPYDDKDIQNYLAPDRQPFVEPALELPIPGIAEGRFDAALLPREDGSLLSCTIMVVDGGGEHGEGTRGSTGGRAGSDDAGHVGEADQVRVYEVPLDAAGRFLVSGKDLDGGHFAPDLTFALATPEHERLALSGRPALAYCLKQERTLAGEEESFLVQRAGRLMLGLRAQPPDRPVTLATVDFGAGADGRIARPPAVLVAGPVGAAPYAMDVGPNARVALPDLVVTDGFGIEAWLYRRSEAGPQLVVGNPDDPTAPRLSVVEGSALEVAFTDGDGNTLRGRTATMAIRRESWCHVQVDFDPERPANARFGIRVNGDLLPHHETGAGTVPNGRPITSLSAATDGFVGALSALAVYDAAGFDPGRAIGTWALETIAYTDSNGAPLVPPETPNGRHPEAPGKVFGAHLLPSSSPVATGDGGALSFDDRGLSIVSGYFHDLDAFGELRSSPALVPSADGFVHCYFQGRDDRFSVMQLDFETARSAFEATWTTAAGAEQTGPIQFLSSQAGAYMNHARIRISDPAGGPAEAFCDVSFASEASGRSETWRGVPRSLVSCAATLNGEAVGDPGDPRLLTGAATYYDASGSRTAAYVPLPGNAGAALAGFVTRQVERLPLHTVEVTEESDELVELSLAHKVPRWDDATLVQTWPAVPASLPDLLKVLEGTSNTYRYRTSAPANVRTYSIAAESDEMNADSVIFFTHPDVLYIWQIEVRDGSDPDLCDVTVALRRRRFHISDDDATWTDVPRRQDLFADTIEGTNPHYDYGALAHGEYRMVGDLLLLTTDGTAAEVGNVSRRQAGGLTPDNDLRVFAGLFEAFVTAPVTAADRLPQTDTIDALAFQGATARVDDDPSQPIVGPSGLFHSHLAALPDQGSVGLVGNTTGFTGGTAVLIREGINGGWRNRPDQRTLAFNGNGYVDFATDEAEAPNIGALTIPGDLSFELWCRPRRSGVDRGLGNQRLVTFARTPAGADPNERVRYLAGLTDCPSLRTEPRTNIYAAYDTTEGTFYTWFSPIATGADADAGGGPAGGTGGGGGGAAGGDRRAGGVGTGTIGSLSTAGYPEPVVALSVDEDAHIRVDFVPDPGAPPIVFDREEVAAGGWYQVALPWSVTQVEAGDGIVRYQLTADLYVNGAWVGRQEWQSADPFGLRTMVIGEFDRFAPLEPPEQEGRRPPAEPRTEPPPRVAATDRPTTLPMQVNEVAFFTRPLAKGEIGQYTDERIADNAADLAWKWMLVEGAGGMAHNSAASGQAFNSSIWKPAGWEAVGLYSRPVLGHGDNVAALAGEPIISGWSHLALSHQAGYALHLEGDDFADCGKDPSTELSDEFSLEAWVELSEAAPKQLTAIVAKGRDYELGVTRDRRPRFSVQYRTGDHEGTCVLEGSEPLATGVAHYLAVTFALAAVQEKDDDEVEQRYEARIELWADGVCVASGIKDNGHYVRFVDPIEPVTTTDDLNLGRTVLYDGSRYLVGYLSDTRLWARVLSGAEIREALASRRPPPDHDGLVSWWRFNEAGGRIAFDAEGDNDAKLNRGDLRVNYQPTSANSFFVDGKAAAPTWVDARHVGGYPDRDRFVFGQRPDDPDDPMGFRGQLDAVRIWDTQLTGEQVSDSMHHALAGSEKHLAGLWAFDDGSGEFVEDSTGRGNTGRLAGDPAPAWSVSTVPLGNEAEGVMNILGGIPTLTDDYITEAPSVIEYADLQRDAYGAVFSVMKRAYVSVDAGRMQLTTGYKVGDLDTVYLGQAQSRPSVIGFIEGAPPLPSENQTMPFWKVNVAVLNRYADDTTVTFTEADDVTYGYTSSRDQTDDIAVNAKGGLAWEVEFGEAFGIGALVIPPKTKFKGEAGFVTGLDLALRRTEGLKTATGTGITMPSGLTPGGAWEPGESPAGWANPTVGRRYVTSNTGMALVKSRTVDLYASVLATTRSTVKVTAAPNPDIPEDVNILTFPIDPTYVKNGTLDGKVGLENDPTYRTADLRRASYFKPIEAYGLKRRVERQEARLAGYYAQYDITRQAFRLAPASRWEDYRRDVLTNEAYDWAAHLSKRNIVNNYVWTAGGGTYAERMSTMNVYSESYGALSSVTSKAGAVVDVSMTFPSGVGGYAGVDALYTFTSQVNVVRSRDSSAGFSLDAAVNPEPFLHAPKIDGNEVTFPSQPTEGKVDGYRYMAFCLAPAIENFEMLRYRVIDPHWLARSMDAGAVALREATVSAGGAWRVLYRVTYVSRIPPRFQPVPDETRSPDVEPPPNPEYNTLIVTLVERAIGRPDPSPTEIGKAIRDVIGTVAEPGPIAELLPWWTQFLDDATDYRLPAAGILRTLREDILRYMIDTYQAREAEAITGPPEPATRYRRPAATPAAVPATTAPSP